MAIIARRLTSTGTMFISGEFNEITTSSIRLTTSTYFSAQFDEVTMFGDSVAMRETSTGTIFVSNGFNEVNKPT